MAEPPSTSAQERLELADALERLTNDPLYYGVFTQPARNAVAALRGAEQEIEAIARSLGDANAVACEAEAEIKRLNAYLSTIENGAALWQLRAERAEEEIRRLQTDSEDWRKSYETAREETRGECNRADEADAALAEMRRMVAEPSEELVKAIAQVVCHVSCGGLHHEKCPSPERCYDYEVGFDDARAALAALARHLRATEGK